LQFDRRAGRHSRHVEKGGRQAAGGFLATEEAAGAAALSGHCPRKTRQAAYGPNNNPAS